MLYSATLLPKISGSFVLREKYNTQADREPRVFIDKRWNCQARDISTSYKNLVEPPFDRFVSKLNAQVSCYASWRPDPGASYVDVFSITWETIFLCFSPIQSDCSLPAQDSEGGNRGHE